MLRYDANTGDFLGVFANLDSPRGIAQGPGALTDVYIGNNGDEKIYRYTREGVAKGAFVDDAANLAGVSGLAFHPSGDLLVSSRNGNEIRRYEKGTGTSKGTFATHADLQKPEDLVYSRSNLFVIINGNGKILEFNGTTGAHVQTFADNFADGYGIADISGMLAGTRGNINAIRTIPSGQPNDHTGAPLNYTQDLDFANNLL